MTISEIVKMLQVEADGYRRFKDESTSDESRQHYGGAQIAIECVLDQLKKAGVA